VTTGGRSPFVVILKAKPEDLPAAAGTDARLIGAPMRPRVHTRGSQRAASFGFASRTGSPELVPATVKTPEGWHRLSPGVNPGNLPGNAWKDFVRASVPPGLKTPGYPTEALPGLIAMATR
jgi:hypothetical protein